MFLRCGNRRVTRCLACSKVYRYGTYQLIAAGLRGGKSVPASVAAHPRVFATLTAPGFGPVHNRPDTGRCHCSLTHPDGDPLLGTPLDPERYDYAGAVLWNAHAPALRARFTTHLRREIAKTAGLTQRALRHRATLSYAKVAEYQKRGQVHFHAVIRLDGRTGPTSEPPAWATAELLDPPQRRPKRPHSHTMPPSLQPPRHRRSPALPRRCPGPSDRSPVQTRPTHRAPQRRTPRPALGRPRPDRRHRHDPPHPPTHPHRWTDHPHHQDHQLRTPHRAAGLLCHLPAGAPRAAGAGGGAGGTGLAGQQLRLHVAGRAPDRTATLTRHFNALLRDAHLRPIRFHDLRHSTATLFLEQGVELVVIDELLGKAHIGVTATVYAHIRLRLQPDAIDLLGRSLGDLAETGTGLDNGDDPPLCAAPVR